MNRSLTEAATDLRSVSQRLVRLEEQGQRELAGELDYEISRSIHALSTRISLAFRDVRDEQMLRLLESVREQVREMQESLRRVLRQLRPQALDTHGLREAIGFGPLRDMLLTNGDHYMHLADLRSYLEADEQLLELYSDSDGWARKAILNVAASGKFSSDRTIAEYATNIWNVEPCQVP